MLGSMFSMVKKNSQLPDKFWKKELSSGSGCGRLGVLSSIN
jgi:hypothetical protein